MAEMTLEQRYAAVNRAGMYIDVRGSVPILFQGFHSWRCNNWLQALTLAEGML